MPLMSVVKNVLYSQLLIRDFKFWFFSILVLLFTMQMKNKALLGKEVGVRWVNFAVC